MTEAQPELDFAGASISAENETACERERLAERLKQLVAILRETRRWMNRRDLEVRGFDERELRRITQYDEAAEIFSYPGSPGYKAFDHVTAAEFEACISLKNQGDKMRRKWLRFQRRWHHPSI